MKISSLTDLFHHHLRKLYSIEQQLIAVLPALAAKASNPELKNALENHLIITQNQLTRLEEMAKAEKIILEGEDDETIKTLIKENERTVDAISNPDLADMAIMGGALKVENLEKAAYGDAKNLADKLNLPQIADSLDKTYGEESETAKKITSLSSGSFLAKITQALTA